MVTINFSFCFYLVGILDVQDCLQTIGVRYLGTWKGTRVLIPLHSIHKVLLLMPTDVTVSGKTTLLAEIEKVGFLLPMDSINTRLCCGTSS